MKRRSLIRISSTGLIIWLSVLGCSSLSTEKIAYQQSFDNGKLIYEEECAKCHKSQGEGLGTLYPPISNTDYIKMDPGSLACIIRNGMHGPLLVNNKAYNWVMPPHKAMDATQIASVLTYVKNSWDKPVGKMNDSIVAVGLQKCGK